MFLNLYKIYSKKALARFLSVVFALFVGLTFIHTSFAQIKYPMVSYSTNNKDATTPLFNLAVFNQPYFTISYQSFANSFQFVFDLIIGISIATAVIVFMIAAFQQIIGKQFTREPAVILKGKDGMQRAIVGLMIVLSTWLIINTINPDLLRLPMFTNLDQLSKNSNSKSTPASAGSLESNGS